MYISLGMYYQLLKPYYARFKSEKIRIFLFEDLESNPSDLLENIFSFLGVNKDIKVDVTKKHNTNPNYSSISSNKRKKLTERFFKDDILLTEGLIGRDLSCWLQ